MSWLSWGGLEACLKKNEEKWAQYIDAKKVAALFLSWPPPADIEADLRVPIPYYTDHGVEHSKRVTKKLDMLITESGISLTSYESFFLLVCCWCHDLGMFLNRKRGETPEHTREIHHLRSAEAVEKLEDMFGLNTFELSIVKEICTAHREIPLNSLSTEKHIGDECIRLRLLAALLRIADECDVDYRRAPQAIFWQYRDLIPKISLPHWKKHFPISSIYFSRHRASIILSVQFSQELSSFVEQNKIAHLIKKELHEELKTVEEVFNYPSYAIGISSVQIQDYESGRLIDETTYPNEETLVLISINPDATSSNFLSKLSTVLKAHPGGIPVILEIRPPVGPLFMKLPSKYSVENYSDLHHNIENIFGDNLVDFRIEEKKQEPEITLLKR